MANKRNGHDSSSAKPLASRNDQCLVTKKNSFKPNMDSLVRAFSSNWANKSTTTTNTSSRSIAGPCAFMVMLQLLSLLCTNKAESPRNFSHKTLTINKYMASLFLLICSHNFNFKIHTYVRNVMWWLLNGRCFLRNCGWYRIDVFVFTPTDFAMAGVLEVSKIHTYIYTIKKIPF